MATKEDRYPKEYKPFHNDKPISSSQGSSSNSSKQHPDFKNALKSTISRHMKGFRATNVITYKRFRDKSTWQRPGEFAELVATNDEDVFTADPKEAWPIMQDMNIDIPVKELTKQHRVVDRNWTAPVSNKKFKQPEPIYPQSTGVKLRNVEDIMNDYSKKAPQTTAPSLSLASSSNATKSLTPNANSIPRVTDKSQRPLQLIPDKIKGVLQNLTDTRRKPAAATPPTKSHSNSSSNNTPRKSSTLKSSAISPKDTKIKKQSTPTITTTDTKPTYPATRPRISSKTIPMEKVIQIDNIPDLMEARKYLVGDDEVEFRSLSSLQEMPKDIQVKERPQLYFRLYPKPDEHDMPKGLKQHIALASVNKNKIKQEKSTSLPSTKNQTKTSTYSKSTTTSLPSDSTSKTVGKSNSKKQSQNDQSQAPIRTSTTKSKKPIKIKEEGEESITSTATPTTNTSTKSAGTSSEKQAYASSVSVEFLRSTKIPKRNNSTNKSSSSSHDMELEEGETISPSPSPIRTKARSSHADVDDESSNIERPASTISRKASTSKRRDEDRSNRDRERDRDRYRDESTSSSRRERSHRHRSKSRSRSPVSKNHRSESRSRRSSPPSRRQTSSESSHRRRSPTARSERDSTRSEKESFIASITTANVSSTRPEKETSRSDRETSRPDKESTSSVSRAERLSDRSEKPEKSERSEKSEKFDKADRETSGRETKRKSLHDSDSKTTNEPPTKRISTKNKDEKPSNNTNSTSTTSTIEKDTKYTNNSNQVSNSSSSSSSKNVKKPAVTTAVAAAAAINVVSTPKSVSTPNTAASISSSTSSSTTIAAVNAPDKVISATAPNAETPEQYKIFTIMFKQLAHANKRRGDTQKNPVIGIIDHFHALCDYMLNFYFVDKVNTNIPFKQASVAWKSLFPFSDSLLSKLQANHLNELYGLCVRLVALIRYYIYSRMESATRPLLTKHLSGSSNQDSYTDRTCIEMTEGLLREHEKAEKCYNDSEKYMTFGKVASRFPGTFKDVCIDGNILAGITLGGEAGVSVGPMFPFTPYSPLHHAAIVSKCILNEYVTKNNLKYSPITKPEEFM